jgi:lipopolysaccharide export LptBFGC system permease protein LptF
MFFYRLSYPISCLIAALLAVGLSSNHHRQETLKNIALSIGALITYYVTSQGFVVFGKSDLIPPLLAGMLPMLATICLGCYLTYKIR